MIFAPTRGGIRLSGNGASSRSTLPAMLKSFRHATLDGGRALPPRREPVEITDDVELLLRRHLQPFLIQPTIQSIKALSRLGEDWDGAGSDAPQPAAISAAIALVPQIYDAVGRVGTEWKPPHVSASEDGEVTFEWWHRQKKLTLYINSEQVEYIKVWGTDIDDEMSCGRLDDKTPLVLWRWLFGI